MKFELVIVIPCYNESQRIDQLMYLNFLEVHPQVFICFVNDGSKDNTLQLLHAIQQSAPHQTHVVSYVKNKGKAFAVRSGVMHCSENVHTQKISYLDADLSTPLEECIRLSTLLNAQTTFVFGARFLRLGAQIKRKPYRFFVGRIIATCISISLKLGVYDTQCGCKVFNSNLVSPLFSESFISKWLFDVELFYRLILLYSKEQVETRVLEVPLNSWIEKGSSKIPLWYGFKLWFDLLKINIHYNQQICQIKQ